MDTLTMQDNTLSVCALNRDWEQPDGTGRLYPENSFLCEVVTDLETSARNADIVVLYEENLLELEECTTLAYGVTADTSIPGMVRLTMSRSIGRGETTLCYLYFTAKEAVTGTGYIAAAPESTLTNTDGTFLFSECTGLLLDVCLPDFNADGITDLRDFTLLAKQYGRDGESAGELYDIAGNDSIDDTDLDYLKKFLFVGITGAEDVETGRVADRTLRAVYTVESGQQTRVTTYEYNAADQLTKVTDCNGNSVYYDYDSCGRLVKVTDQAGYASEILYDTAGNPVQVVLPEGVTETYTYDTEGNLLSVTDSLGAVTSYSYDASGRTVSMTDAVGVTYQYQYDIAGNLVKNLFTGEEYCYNAYDEVVSFTDAEGNVTTVQYDAQGNVTDTTDALGNVTSYTYRKDGLLTKITDASGAITLYEYNGKGLLAKETDALGAVTSYEYDRENRPVKVMAPDGTVTEYSYNTDGSITKITAIKSAGENSADGENGTAGENNAAGEKEELRYLYALDGSLTASISSTDILAYTYDIRGYVESVTKNNSHTISLAYDGNGNLTLLKEKEAGTYITDSITSYFYDTRGYLSEVRTGGTLTYHTAGYNQEGIPFFTETSEGGELLASYISRADGLLEQVTDGAGTVTKYQYNQQKQVTGLTVTAADGTVQYRETNTYDRNGSLLTQTIGDAGCGTESLSFTYDELDRLLSETKNGKTTSYTYDSMGNRLTKTADGVTTSYVYDLCNKLLSETTGEEVVTYSYDELGNLTTKTGAEGTTTYAYDALNQMTEVVNPDGTWQRNSYDASGIRSMITENGITTEFMTFNGLVVSGYNKHGEQTEHYFYGNSLVAAEYAVLNADSAVSYGDDTDGVEIGLYYYLKNSHGDVIGLTNNTGTLTETYRYDSFGTLTKIQSMNENGVLAETDTALSRFLYSGEQYDKVTGLYYLRARQYDTLTGRFTQEDTYLGDGRNLYVYVSSNPLKYVDPSGHGKAGSGDSTLWNVVKGAAVVTTSVVVSAVVEELCPPLGIAMDVMDLSQAIKDKNALGIAVGIIGFVPIAGTVIKKGKKIGEALISSAPAIGKVIKKTADAVGPALKKAGDVISEVSGKVTKKVTEVFSEATAKVKTKASELVDAVKSGASSLMDKAKGAWDNLFKKADDVVEEVAEGAAKLGQKAAGNGGSTSTTKPYTNSRPSFRKGVVEEVWEKAKGPDGIVRDPNTGDIINWNPGESRKGVWDMGHLPEAKYSDMYDAYMNGDLTTKEFVDWYNDPSNYRPELPSNNRSHKYE